MLTLERRKGEDIVIGRDGGIVITVLDIRGGEVWLGISAPIEIPVHRREIFNAIKREEEEERRLYGPQGGL